jgi:hypothetical protein
VLGFFVILLYALPGLRLAIKIIYQRIRTRIL